MLVYRTVLELRSFPGRQGHLSFEHRADRWECDQGRGLGDGFSPKTWLLQRMKILTDGVFWGGMKCVLKVGIFFLELKFHGMGFRNMDFNLTVKRQKGH